MNRDTGLTTNELKSISKVFELYPVIDSVVLFGSRAKRNFKNASDIDLAIKGAEVNLKCVLDLNTDLDDLMFPYKFDLINFNHINEQDLIDHIKHVGLEIYNKKNQIIFHNQ